MAIFNASPPPRRVRSLMPASLFAVAWQDAQPPTLNIALPFSSSGAYVGSSDAGTVAGIVTIQNTRIPNMAPAMAMTASFNTAAPSSFAAVGRVTAPDQGCKCFRSWHTNPPRCRLPSSPWRGKALQQLQSLCCA
jgi:hypothetical protein